MRHSLKKNNTKNKIKQNRKNNSISMKIEKDEEEKSLSANKLRNKSDKKNIKTIQFDKIKIINKKYYTFTFNNDSKYRKKCE